MRRTRGSATAETAVALPALMVVLAVALWALAAARGEVPQAVRSVARRVAPDHAQVVVRRTGAVVRVSVRAPVRPAGTVMTGLPTLTVRGSAAAEMEGR